MIGYSFDLSKSNTGMAKWLGGNLAQVASVSFQEHHYFGHVLIDFERFIDETFVDPSWVAYEEVMVRNKLHGELHFGMVALLAIACCEMEVPLIGINTMTMKKQVVGTGRATKEEMLETIRARYPEHYITDHDVADAVAVGIMAISMMEVRNGGE